MLSVCKRTFSSLQSTMMRPAAYNIKDELMSWDVALYKFKDGNITVLGDDGEPKGESLGNYIDVRLILDTTLSLHWDDMGWATLSSPDFTIEFNLNKEAEDIRHLTLHIQNPEFALHAVQELCVKNELFALDLQNDRLIDINNLDFFDVEEDLDDEWDEDDMEEFSELTRRPSVKEIKYI